MNKFLYTIKHKRAFLEVEKRLLGRNTLRGWIHDVDKLIMMLVLPGKVVSRIHRKHAGHHDNGKAKTREDYIEMVIDWECARYTKPDKPLNAVQTMEKYYPHLRSEIEPILKEFGLLSDDLYEVVWGRI